MPNWQKKINKNEFELNEKKYKINGSMFSGLVLVADGERYIVSQAVAWYEYILALFAFVFDMIWGNIGATVKIFPIVAGLLGGAICGFMAVVNFYAMKATKNKTIKVVVGLAISFLAIIICHLIGLAFLNMFK